jgi:hypothetical protein
MQRLQKAMPSFETIGKSDDSLQALSIILAAWDEGTEAGVAPELMAYAALFTALTDLVALFGEEAVVKLARGLEQRVSMGEFTLNRVTQ